MDFAELSTSMAEWFNLYKQYKNGYHMSDSDIKELVRLNHILIFTVHEVHNESMSNDSFKQNR